MPDLKLEEIMSDLDLKGIVSMCPHKSRIGLCLFAQIRVAYKDKLAGKGVYVLPKLG